MEKAYWQIALTDSDEKLERALGRLLAPVLLKASSKDSAVREKVLNLEVKMVLTSVHKSLRWTATVLEGHFKEYHSSLTACFLVILKSACPNSLTHSGLLIALFTRCTTLLCSVFLPWSSMCL